MAISDKSQKLSTYEPMTKQLTFHQSAAACRAIFGGNRSGKTTCGGMEFLFHITGNYPDWYPKDQRWSGAIKGRIVARDYAKGVGEIISPFMDEWLDKSLVSRPIKNHQGIITKYFMKNGSVFDILTHEQDTEQFEGWKGHIAWFDEPPPRDKYIATLRGLVDYSGRHWLTLTPLTQPWIYDDIYTKADGKRIFVATVDMRDNTHLSEADILQFEKTLTEEEKEARIHGKFMHLTGLVYKDFDPDIHIIDPPEVKKDWTKYFAIDPHERKATACLWLAVDPKGNLYVYDELSLKDMDIEAMALAIHAQEGDNPAQIRLIDPHMDKDNAIAGGFNTRKELMKHGIFTERANSDPMLGKARIRQALKPQYSSLLKRNVPTLFVSRYCRNTIYEFQHYIWDDYRRNKDEHDPKEAVKKKNDDMMDCLRYIFNNDPRYIQHNEEDDVGVSYEGEFTKYPVKKVRTGGYYDLVQ